MTRTTKSKDDSAWLWFDDRTTNREICSKIEEQASTLRRLCLLSQSFLSGGYFADLDLPNLTELTVYSIHWLDNPKGWSFLNGLKSLKTFVSGTCTGNDSILAGLSEVPWWDTATQVELRLLGLEKTTKWNSLWTDRKLSMEILCVHYPDQQQACSIFDAQLSNLQYLIVGMNKGTPFLDRISTADLPSLEDLELRHADVPEADVVKFLKTSHPNLPKLKRVGRNFYSDRRYDVCDWNGAVVDYDYEQLSDSEIEKQIFKGTKYSILPSNFQLEVRSGPNSNSLKPLERLK